jgi:hypothetical protein
MRMTSIVIAACFVLGLALLTRDAGAAVAKGDVNGTSSVIKADTGATLFAAAAKKPADVKPPKDKPKKSKKNPNDDKDNDPDDGDAGGGNDNKTKPNDGPIND